MRNKCWERGFDGLDRRGYALPHEDADVFTELGDLITVDDGKADIYKVNICKHCGLLFAVEQKLETPRGGAK